ncbi:MAG: sigma-70 family RNA polymerase sigma factor [Planctomycetales bacterium]|nr:sigma-70 family RNA polymerase sigma factor [Planctomycetales bacterium]
MNHSSHVNEIERLLGEFQAGNKNALNLLIEHERDYLRRLIDLRLEPALRGRVDPSDVVQETMIVVSQRIDDFLRRRPTTFRLWVRRKALERLIDARRRHQAVKRSFKNEVHLSDASSMLLAKRWAAQTPSQIVQRKEEAERIRRAVQELGETDREVLLLRHVEELSNNEIAKVLGVAVETASRRYGRAVRNLAELLLKE